MRNKDRPIRLRTRILSNSNFQDLHVTEGLHRLLIATVYYILLLIRFARATIKHRGQLHFYAVCDSNCRSSLYTVILTMQGYVAVEPWSTLSRSLHFYRAMHFSAERGLAIARRLSVCPSVTLVICDHIGWKSWKLISQTIISPTPSLFVAKRRSTYSLSGEHGGIWGRLEVG